MRLRNPLWGYVVLAVILLLAVLIPALLKARSVAQRVLCGTNYKGLSIATGLYAKEYDDCLPTENWCDIFIKERVLSPEILVCPASGAIEGESSYAMNKNIAGMKLSDVPRDVVWFFETDMGLESGPRSTPITSRRHYNSLKELKDIYHGFVYDEDTLVYEARFNQVGGPEDLVLQHKANGRSGCNTGFVYGSRFVTEDELAELRWTIEEQ